MGSSHAILEAWRRPSVFFLATRIACDWRRSSAIATGRRSTFSGLGSFSCRPTACRCWLWAPDRRQPTGGMAMAATLHRGGCRRAVARQDAQARQEAAAGGDRGQNPGAAVRQAAPTSHSLDGPKEKIMAV